MIQTLLPRPLLLTGGSVTENTDRSLHLIVKVGSIFTFHLPTDRYYL